MNSEIISTMQQIKSVTKKVFEKSVVVTINTMTSSYVEIHRKAKNCRYYGDKLNETKRISRRVN